VFISVIGIALGLFLVRRLRTNIGGINYFAVIFLLVGIALPLLPVILLQSHPSETYLYLPVGFYVILLSYVLAKFLGTEDGFRLPNFYVSTVVILILFFSSATWVRNKRVFECGETARHILGGLPDDRLRSGSWKLSFANVPGEKASRRYGFYGFHGIDTIGHGPIADRAITSALQLVYQNESLSGEVVQPEDLVAKCRESLLAHHICLWVHSDGRVENIVTNLKQGSPSINVHSAPKTVRSYRTLSDGMAE
jgi:hypothetical protein